MEKKSGELSLVCSNNREDPSTVTLWTEESRPGPPAEHTRGKQGTANTNKWPLITTEYDPSITDNWPEAHIQLNDVLVVHVCLHRSCQGRAQN